MNKKLKEEIMDLITTSLNKYHESQCGPDDEFNSIRRSNEIIEVNKNE